MGRTVVNSSHVVLVLGRGRERSTAQRASDRGGVRVVSLHVLLQQLRFRIRALTLRTAVHTLGRTALSPAPLHLAVLTTVALVGAEVIELEGLAALWTLQTLGVLPLLTHRPPRR